MALFCRHMAQSQLRKKLRTTRTLVRPRTPLVVELGGNSKSIEEIQEGDWLVARSEFNPQGPLELKWVEEKFVRTAILNRSPVLLLYHLLLSRSAASLLRTRSRTFCSGG